jgi:hypothetical protein
MALTGCGTFIDERSRCQVHAPNPNWQNAGLNADLRAPSDAQCPLLIDYYNQPQGYNAVIDAPASVLIEPFAEVSTVITDALARFAGESRGFFGPTVAGRRSANDIGSYQVGRAGTQENQQDRAETYLATTLGFTQNFIYMPYKLKPLPAAMATLPRVKVGQATTVRVFPNVPPSPPPTVTWYVNDVQQSAQSNPWDCCGVSKSAITKTFYTRGTYRWKMVLTYGFPTKTLTRYLTQVVE